MGFFLLLFFYDVNNCLHFHVFVLFVNLLSKIIISPALLVLCGFSSGSSLTLVIAKSSGTFHPDLL